MDSGRKDLISRFLYKLRFGVRQTSAGVNFVMGLDVY